MSVLAAGHAALRQVAFLADDTDVGDETHKAGPIAILVIVVLCVACFVLFRSMTKHMRRVREQFPAAADASAAPVGDPPPTTTGTTAVSGRARPAPKSRAHVPDE